MYLVDAGFFVQAHHMDYPLEEALPFWECVKELAEKDVIASVDRVRKYLWHHEQALEDWCEENLPKKFFKRSTIFLKEYRKVLHWVMSKKEYYLPCALRDFLSTYEASPWLIAYSLQNNCTIVTYESNHVERKDQIRIPDVCDAFNIPCVNTAQMFSRLGLML